MPRRSDKGEEVLCVRFCSGASEAQLFPEVVGGGAGAQHLLHRVGASSSGVPAAWLVGLCSETGETGRKQFAGGAGVVSVLPVVAANDTL